MNPKYWIYFSIIILIYFLDLLNEESNHFKYDDVKGAKLDNKSDMFYCFPIAEFKNNQSLSKIIFIPNLLNKFANQLNQQFNLSINSSNSYFFNLHVCYQIELDDYNKANRFLSLEYKVFDYSRNLRPPFYQNILLHKKESQPINNLIVRKIGILLIRTKNFKCDNNIYLDNNQEYTFFNCFMQCVKLLSLKSIYIYEYYENVHINLENKLRNLTEEGMCIRKCNLKINCRVDYYYAINLESNDVKAKIMYEISQYNAFFPIEGFEYWLQLIEEYFRLRKYPITTSFFAFNYGYLNLNIIICIPVQSIIFNTFNLSESNEIDILKLSFQKIENQTNNGIFMVLESILKSYGTLDKSIDWKIDKNDILLTFNDYKFNSKDNQLLDRCFRIDYFTDQPTYETLLINSNLIFLTKENANFKLFINEKSSKFLKNSREYVRNYRILKSNEKKLETAVSNCTDYSRSKNAYNYQYELEKCKIKKYYNQYSSLITEVVIDKNELIKQLKIDDFNKLFFNKTKNLNIENECVNELKQVDCSKIELRYHYKYGFPPLNRSEINLHTMNFYNLHNNYTFWKAFFKIINLVSILYGLNMKNLLSFILSSLSFNENNLILFLICFILFLIHLGLIFNDTIFSKYDCNGFFLNEPIIYPDLIFCLPIDVQTIDKNQRITGNYLNRLFNVSGANFFDKIIYYNKTEFIEYRPSILTKDNNFKISEFYFLNSKCIQLSCRINYTEAPVYALDDNFLIKIYLNRKILPDYFYFTTKKQDTKEFNLFAPINSSQLINHKIRLDSYSMKFKDKFKIIRNPFILLYDDYDSTTTYLDKIVNKFKLKYNLTTTLISLEDKDFSLEINDKIFEQFYIQIQNKTNQIVKPDYFTQRSVYEYVYLGKSNQLITNQTFADFEFSSSFLNPRTHISNEDNFIKLLQNILNCLTMHLSINMLDLYIYLNKIISLINWIYKILFKLKLSIKFNLKNN